MSDKKRCGLIGEKLGHSFSREIHQRLGGYDYLLQELTPAQLPAFLEKRDFRGINVTIPYKQTVIPLLDEVDPKAAAIGAVTIKIALAVVAAKVVLGKVVLPLIGTLVRTFLFALIVALLMLLQADITAWTIILPLILGVLIVSGLSDCAFGC